MAEGGQLPFSSELCDSRLTGQPLGPNCESSTASHPPQVDQRDMEFAPMPSNHFGPMGLAHSPFDMRHLSNALSDYSQRYHQSQGQPPITQASMVDPGFAYSPYSTQQFVSHLANQYQSQYPQALPSQYKGMGVYGTNMPGNATEIHASRGPLYPQQQPLYAPNMSQQPHYPNFPGQQHLPYGHPTTSPYQARTNTAYPVPRVQVENLQVAMGSQNLAQDPEAPRRTSSSSSLPASSTLRGPPRKPKQSGHALWVGNLPPGTQIVDLKDHFSREATEDIESVFLISKSNCAFVNYKTEEACAAAMTRFHDSRFRGVRLVCRLRRGSNAAASPASTAVQPDLGQGAPLADLTNEAAPSTTATSASSDAVPITTPKSSPEKLAREKFFIVKSLTVEDLERAVTSGIWATQAHNEDNLNAAFESAENVYLIFSANKSGEYFGYARMESSISAEAVPIKELEKQEMMVQKAQQPGAASVPLTIPTPATSTAPRGHIVDDSARGTIFWEADSGDLSPGDALEGTSGDSGETSGDDSGPKGVPAQPTTFGKAFQISWQSTERLPFYRTRGLRNPWNANREVKIARDGTELEPTIGRKLIGMFEQQAQINAAARSSGPPPQYGGYPPQMPPYASAGMMAQMPYGYGPQGPGQPYGRPY